MWNAAITPSAATLRWAPLIVLPWVIGLLLSVYGASRDALVSQREQTADAVVVAHREWDHDQYDFQYVVGGHPFVGADSPKSGSLKLGEHVLVHFDPEDPKRSSLSAFSELAWSEAGPAPILVLGIVGMLFFVSHWRKAQALP